jgi:hypothetical protein
MSKDDLDQHTDDILPKKIGRPTIKETGPLSSTERSRRLRAKKKAIQITLERYGKIEEIALRKGIKPQEVIDSMIDRARLP